jgi:cell division protein ZipA
MSELRWILLVAGLCLIAGVYAWGMRGRLRSAAADVERPARSDPPAAAPVSAPGEPARLEPSVSLDQPAPAFSAPQFDEDALDTPPSMRSPSVSVRREPTMGTRVDPARSMPQRPAQPRPVPEIEPAREPSVAATPAPAAEARPAPQAPAARAPQKIVAIRLNAAPPARFDGAKLLEALKSEELEFGRYEIFHKLHDDGRPIFSVANLREPGTFDPGTMGSATFPGIALFAVLPGPVPAAEAFDQLIFTARALAQHVDGNLADEKGGPLTVHRMTRLREELIEFERQRSGGG